MIASYYSVFWKWEFFLLFLHLFNRITSSSFQQIKKKASKKSDFVILLCSILLILCLAMYVRTVKTRGIYCSISWIVKIEMLCNAELCCILLVMWKKYVSTMDSCTNSMSPVSTSYVHLNLDQHLRLFWFICFWIKLPQK